jgi:hypothetical protein
MEREFKESVFAWLNFLVRCVELKEGEILRKGRGK